MASLDLEAAPLGRSASQTRRSVSATSEPGIGLACSPLLVGNSPLERFAALVGNSPVSSRRTTPTVLWSQRTASAIRRSLQAAHSGSRNILTMACRTSSRDRRKPCVAFDPTPCRIASRCVPDRMSARISSRPILRAAATR